ncbi:hypothetical protein MANES_15G132101v8 [Manihot esculenta]|uniref:Uncharacterized protein n=1 Tax=Manihot esculenta TaxID=3983 RepID=A0ACB7GBT4_MANES|nr:hypothetical protein MANES_15G132101v8 [Manihot esculenta]
MIEGDDYPVLQNEHDLFHKPECFHAFIILCTLHLAFRASTAFVVMHLQVSLVKWQHVSQHAELKLCDFKTPPLYWLALYGHVWWC